MPIGKPIVVPSEILVATDATPPYKKFEDDFTGAWLPKGDPVRIGAKNYANIENMRYTDFGLEGVGGYSRINTTTTDRNITNAIQLKTNYDQESYIIAQGLSLIDNTPILITNTGTIPDTSNFNIYEWLVDNTNNILALQSYYTGGATYSGYVYLNITQTAYASGSALASIIQTAMNYNSVLNQGDALTFAVSYSTTTNKFTIATTGGTCKYYEVANTIGSIIGFTATSSAYSASLVSDTATEYTTLYNETDNSTDTLARMSLLPNGHVGICNEYENLIWAGDEMPIGAFLYGTEPTITIAGANNELEFTSNHGTATITIPSTTYTGITLAAAIQTQIRANGTLDLPSATVEFRISKFYIDAGEASHTILFTGNGDAAYTVGFTVATTAAKTMLGAAPYIASPYFYNLSDNTTILNNAATSTGNTFSVGNAAAYKYFLIGSTRPIQGMKIKTTSGAFTTSTLSGKYFDGEKFVTLDSLAVSTSSSVDTVTFEDTSSLAKPMFIDGYYLYFYRFELSTGTVIISNITLNAIIQDLIDLWDGIYRTCLKFIYIKYEGSKYNRREYTLETIDQTIRKYNYDSVDEDLDLAGLIPIGANSGGTALGLNEADEDYIEVLFREPMCAFKWDLFRSETGGDVNSMTVYFWDGSQYVKAQNVYDTIKNAEAGLSNYYMLEQGGIQFFEIPLYNSDGTAYTGLEKQSEINDIKGYKYKISWTYESLQQRFLTLILDQFTGVPRYKTIQKLHKFPFMYKNRAMWCNSQSDKEYNRADYSMANQPDVYNGEDASGTFNERSLYFGDNSALTSAIELYGQYGDNIETVALFFKNNETYMLMGDNPETFRIYTVSKTVGNVAPLSLVAAEVSFPSANQPDQNIAMWISDKGPVIFLGNSIRAVPGLEPYFDPEDTSGTAGASLYLGAAYIKEARAWYDYMYKEYNVIIPTSTSASANKWFVYDLVRQKWYQKVPTADYPSGAITVEDTDGNKYNYGYTSTGYMLKMEDGLYWSSTNKMQHKVKSADMILSGSLWEESTARQIKLVHEDNDAGVITINHYINGNTAYVAGMVKNSTTYYKCNVTHVAGTFATDFSAGLWAALSYLTSGATWVTAGYYRAYPAEISMAEASNYRYKHLLHKLNVTGFSHAFEFIINNCTAKKPKLLGWSVEYDTQEDVRADTAS